MATAAQRPELLIIIGPTASGKSDLALKIAQKFNGEIIAADSRTIYKGMDIGTAKPSKEEQKQIPHWGIDLVGPGGKFSAARFKKYAEEKIEDAQRRGKLPIIVGGTGLYIDSVLYGYQFSPAGSERDPINPRHLKQPTIQNKKLRPGVIIIGLQPPDEVLKQRIAKRAENYFKTGLLEEIQALRRLHSQKAIESGGIAYKTASKLANGEITKTDSIELIKKDEWQYARRQRTWFKRNKFIRWFDSPDKAYQEVAKILNN